MNPTNGELIFWCVLLLATILGLILINRYVSSHSSNSIDDMAAWSRNYEKLQRRRKTSGQL